MNPPDDPLCAPFQRQRALDESRAPSFAAMSARARVAAASGKPAPHRAKLLWLAPAAAAVVIAALILRPSPPAGHDYSTRIAALIAELDAPTFAQADLPSDLLPRAFPQP